ncbi:MAG TPA: glycoside hydrolase family 6 protein [Jiangellaceae bacterium]
MINRLRRRRTLAGGAALLLAAAGLAAATAVPAHAAPGCDVQFSAGEWNDGAGGFTGSVILTNTGDPISGWTLEFDLPGSASLTHGWSADWSQSGQTLTATNLDWNGNLGTGDSTTIGFNGTGYAGDPATFFVNGVECGGDPGVAPPDVSLTSPASGQEFLAGSPVTLAADASSSIGIERVDFFVDGQPVGSDSAAPYEVTVNDLALGGHTATAEAYDTASGEEQQSTVSDPVSFSVAEEVLPPDPELAVSPSSLSVVEGESGTLTFSLTEPPAEPVTVTLATTANVSVSPTTFQLDTGTQDVAVTGLSVGSGSVTASAPGLDDLVVAVNVTDDQVPPRADNPYEGADVYVNPDWAGTVLDQAASTGGALGAAMEEVASYPTFVWMDRIGAITDGTGLVGHLDNAAAQDAANGSTPTVFQVVIYDLPNRDCAALASNGELRISENGFEIYREDYVDVIDEILSRPEYANLRIVAVIEVDSLPNLVTNLDEPDCAEANGPGGYRDGIRYVLNSFSDSPNIYSYLDIAHSGWLGWDDNFNDAVNLYVDTLTSDQWFGPAPGLDSIAGFVTNSANYTPTVEPFLPDSSIAPPGGGNPIRSADFYEWNPHFDEMDFAQALHDAFSARGMSEFGMLIDTGRNGWGGSDRPTEVSTSTDLNTYVDESRIDRRPHRGGWCNQDGAGIGERPTASPAENIDAFVWVKPPGESDGVSDPDFEQDPNDPNKQHDPMCDPNAQNRYNTSLPTNALPDAPHAGRWFPEQFQMLVENAWPAF